MAKGQQKSNKESKKPKKDTSAPKTLTGEPMRAAVTTVVMPRGKEKNKWILLGTSHEAMRMDSIIGDDWGFEWANH